MNTVKITSEKQIHTADLFTIDAVTLLLPTGKTMVHEVVRRKPTVSVFPLTDSNEVYLVSQYRYMVGATTLEAMGGFIENGETVEHAGKRELQEETGITAKYWKPLMTVKVAGSVIDTDNHLLIAQGLTFGETNFQDEEDITLIKLPLEEAVKKVLSGQINHATSMIGLMLLDKMKQERSNVS